MKFEWRDKLAQFWNKTVGRLIPRLQVREAADAVIDASPVKKWATRVASGEMRVGAWEQAMRDEIRRNYIEQYLAGRGGTGPMTAKEYGSIGGMIADQYRYLSDFAREVASGTLSEGQITRRAEMYVNSSREAYERAQKRAVAETDLDEVRWILDPQAEHCTGEPGCEELAAMGWRRVAPWPFRIGRAEIFCGSGHTPCLTA